MARRPHSPVRSLRVPSLRRHVEAQGWRTWLAYRENQRRDASGRLVEVETVWVAEAEHGDGRVLTCAAPSPTAAWLDLVDAVRRSRPTVEAPHLLAG